MNIETIIALEEQWALGDCSIDFDSFDSNETDPVTNTTTTTSNKHSDSLQKPQQMNDCSRADTISTAGESSSFSWGESSLALNKLYCNDDSEDDDDSDSNGSLTLGDLESFAVEDQVGLFNPDRTDIAAVRRRSQLASTQERRASDIPPPPPQPSDFKGDSQNSFTLEDLELDFEEEQEEEKNDNDDDNNESLGDLVSPSASSRRASRRRSSLESILKNGSSNARRSSSLAMMMMEDSSLFQMSSTLGELDDSAENAEEEWNLMMLNNNQSLDIDAALDLRALPERHVSFSQVVVHEHGCILGDNPACSDGAPIMLDWNALESTTYQSVDDYEQQCSSRPARKLDAEERLWRLLDAGATLPAIQQAELEAGKARAERESTRQIILLGNVKPIFYKYIQNTTRERELSRPKRRKSPRRN